MKKYPSPAYILEEKKLRDNLEKLAYVQREADVQIILAFKAFSMWSAFPIVREYLSGATASSLSEALLCYEEMGVKAHSYCVAYIPREFGRILKCSSHITFNTISQYRRFKKRIAKYELESCEKISAGIRVNPEFSTVETDLYNPALPGSRLGEMVENFKGSLPEGVEGLHFHVLCESKSTDLALALEHFEARFGQFLPILKWVNFGGGHLISHADYDIEHLISVLRVFKKRYPNLNVILEPGSAIAWQTGFLTATVLDIVESRGIKTAILDVSFTCHLPDTLEMPYRPDIRGVSKEHFEGAFPYRLGGVSCLSGDYLAEYYFEKKIKIGQQLVLEDMMHYTMVKTSTFNGVTHPDIMILQSDGTLKRIKRFGYRDFKRRLS